jgi:ssDNA-binding Zn-finger/Zn-ribbon topoisomerase 1
MVDVKNDFRRLVGRYLRGFNYVSDNIANIAKKIIETAHYFVPTIALITLAHKGVEQLEKTRDKVGKVIHKYAFCTKCRGKGYLMVMSVGGEYVGREPCPQCHGTGMDFKQTSDYAAKVDKLPTLSKKEAAIRVFDRMIEKTRLDKGLPTLYCDKCKGQRLMHVRTEDGKYLGQKPCPHCNGTGKDYNAMGHNLMKSCIRYYMDKGFSSDEAWNYCISSFHSDKQKHFTQ